MWSPTWVGERLRAEGLITAAQLSATVQAMQLYNERMEESLLRIGAIDEDRLLRFAAERMRTQFVSTAKLSRLQVTDQALRLVPERVAEKLLLFPVRYEADADTLSVVSPDAGDPEYKKQLSIAIRVREVKAYIARPAAVKAAIAKWYRGETNPFAMLVSDAFMLGNAFEEPRPRATDTRPGPAGRVLRDAGAGRAGASGSFPDTAAATRRSRRPAAAAHARAEPAARAGTHAAPGAASGGAALRRSEEPHAAAQSIPGTTRPQRPARPGLPRARAGQRAARRARAARSAGAKLALVVGRPLPIVAVSGGARRTQ